MGGGKEIFNLPINGSPYFKQRQCPESFETWVSFKVAKNSIQVMHFQQSLWVPMNWAEIAGRMLALVQV